MKKGQKMSEESRKKLIGELNPMKRPEVREKHKKSLNRPQTKEKIGESTKKRWRDPAEREKNIKGVLIYNVANPEKAHAVAVARGHLGGLKNRGRAHTRERIERITVGTRAAMNTPEARENCRKAMMGERYDKNHRVAGSPATRRELYKLQNGLCYFCNEEIQEADLQKSRVLETHHKDHDRSHDVIQNLALAHKKCHAIETREYQKQLRKTKESSCV